MTRRKKGPSAYDQAVQHLRGRPVSVPHDGLPPALSKAAIGGTVQGIIQGADPYHPGCVVIKLEGMQGCRKGMPVRIYVPTDKAEDWVILSDSEDEEGSPEFMDWAGPQRDGDTDTGGLGWDDPDQPAPLLDALALLAEVEISKQLHKEASAAARERQQHAGLPSSSWCNNHGPGLPGAAPPPGSAARQAVTHAVLPDVDLAEWRIAAERRAHATGPHRSSRYEAQLATPFGVPAAARTMRPHDGSADPPPWMRSVHHAHRMPLAQRLSSSEAESEADLDPGPDTLLQERRPSPPRASAVHIPLPKPEHAHITRRLSHYATRTQDYILFLKAFMARQRAQQEQMQEVLPMEDRAGAEEEEASPQDLRSAVHTLTHWPTHPSWGRGAAVPNTRRPPSEPTRDDGASGPASVAGASGKRGSSNSAALMPAVTRPSGIPSSAVAPPSSRVAAPAAPRVVHVTFAPPEPSRVGTLPPQQQPQRIAKEVRMGWGVSGSLGGHGVGADPMQPALHVAAPAPAPRPGPTNQFAPPKFALAKFAPLMSSAVAAAAPDPDPPTPRPRRIVLDLRHLSSSDAAPLEPLAKAAAAVGSTAGAGPAARLPSAKRAAPVGEGALAAAAVDASGTGCTETEGSLAELLKKAPALGGTAAPTGTRADDAAHAAPAMEPSAALAAAAPAPVSPGLDGVAELPLARVALPGGRAALTKRPNSAAEPTAKAMKKRKAAEKGAGSGGHEAAALTAMAAGAAVAKAAASSGVEEVVVTAGAVEGSRGGAGGTAARTDVAPPAALKKWGKPGPGRTRPQQVADIVNQVVEVPCSVFAQDDPELFYRAKIMGPDARRKESVVIQMVDDRSRYFFPIGQVREWLAHMEARAGAQSPR